MENTHDTTPLLENIEPEKAERVRQLVETLANGEPLNEETLTILLHGLEHDEDVRDADAQGYIRGRNEKIDAVTTRPVPLDDAPETTMLIPHCDRRSIWD